MAADDETISDLDYITTGSNTRRIKPLTIEYEDNRPASKFIVLRDVEDADEINGLEINHTLVSDLGVAAVFGGRPEFEDSLAFSLATGSNENRYASFVVSDGVGTSIASRRASIFNSERLVRGLQEGRDPFHIIEEVTSDLGLLREEITRSKLTEQFDFIERILVDKDDEGKDWFNEQLEVLGIDSGNELSLEDYARVRDSIVQSKKEEAMQLIAKFNKHKWGKNGYEEDEKEFLAKYQKSLQTTTTGARLIATEQEGRYHLETITFGDPKIYRFRQGDKGWKMERISRGTSVDNDLWEYSLQVVDTFLGAELMPDTIPVFRSDNPEVNKIVRSNYDILKQIIGVSQTSKNSEFHFEKFHSYLKSLTIGKNGEKDFQKNMAFNSKRKSFTQLFDYIFEGEVANEGLFSRIMSDRNKVYHLLRIINWDNTHNVYSSIGPNTNIEYTSDKYYSRESDIRSGDIILMSSDDDEDIPYDVYEELVTEVMYQDHARPMQHLVNRIKRYIGRTTDELSSDNGVKLAFQVK